MHKPLDQEGLNAARTEPGLRSSSLPQLVIDLAPLPILVIDAQGKLRYANEATAVMLGWPREQLETMSIFDIAPHRRPDMWADSVHTLKQRGPLTLNSDWQTSDGRTLALELSACFMPIGAADHILIFARDASAQQRAQEQAFRLAHIDETTGLSNRKMLQDRIDSEALLAVRDGRRIGLLAIDVNEIRQINESLGYALGDQLLRTLARRMSSSLRGASVLAHLGTGEFALLLTLDTDLDDDIALQISSQIRGALTTPVRLEDKDIMVTCGIGIAIFPQDASKPNHLLRQAQAAMRMANALGANQIGFYTPEANARASEQQAREAALHNALEHGEFRLLYQPQVNLKTGQIIGVEALLRWHCPTLGEVPPDAFIPIAESTGLILPINNWVLQVACEAAARWTQMGLPAIQMAINLSPRQLRLPDVASAIQSVLMQTALPPQRLSIEVTEGMLMDDLDHAARALSDIRSIGVNISLDGFGMGHSSLSSLRRLPINVIKIDRSLVPDVTAATRDVSITRAIINMAHSMQTRVMAVGVESEGELALLMANQCDLMQGNFFSKPLTEDELLSLLREGKQLPGELLGRQARQRTLLIVDDEDNIVSALKRLLRRDGYNIVTASSGQQGLQRLAEHQVDVILSDQRMPGMTGVDFLRQTKELYPQTIRMVLSGYTELQSITDAINEGAIYKFLTKPWDDERVRAHIREAFEQKEMADENRRLGREVQQANLELADVNRRLKALLATQSERIQKEEASLVIARDALESIPCPIFGIDREGMISFMNSDAELLFNDAFTLLGMHLDDIGCPSLARLWQTQDEQQHDIEVQGRAYRAVCRAMKGDAQSRGALMVLMPNASR